MTYTSIEQSKRLMELGLNPDSADMYYHYMYHDALDGGGGHYESRPEVCEWTYLHKGLCGKYDSEKTRDIPCWSAECLLNILPNIIKTGEEVRNWYWININKEPYQITYGSSLGSSGSWHDMISSTQSYKFIDAVYCMMEWILETLNKKEFPFDNDLNNELYGILGRTTEKEIV